MRIFVHHLHRELYYHQAFYTIVRLWVFGEGALCVRQSAQQERGNVGFLLFSYLHSLQYETN